MIFVTTQLSRRELEEKMKKILLIVVIALFLQCNMAVIYAKENKELYILTEDITKVDHYVQNQVGDLLLKHTKDINLCLNAYIGGGVKVFQQGLENYYFYPIIINQEIKFVVRITLENNQYNMTLSEILANELNNMKSTKEDPISIFLSNNNLVAVNSVDTIVLDEDHINKKDYSQLEKEKSREKNDNRQIKDIYNSIKPLNISISRAAPSEFYLKIDYKEKQTSLPWCVGYASANILRFMTGNSYIYASTIAQFGSVSSSQGIPTSVVKNYARAFANITVTEYSGRASISTIRSHLSYSRPIMGYYRSTTNASSAHALVIHGLSTGSTVTIRNPWYQYSETYNGDTGTYTATNGTKWSNYAYVTFVK